MNEVGLGTRVLNFFIDTLLIFIITYALYKWYNLYVFYYYWKYYPFYLWFYAVIFFYYFLFESMLGRSPAKYLTLSVVQTVAGKKPAVHLVFVRSLLRLTLIDPFFIPFLKRPLHDALSKTRVVES